MNKHIIRKKFGCSVQSYANEAMAQQQIAQKMAGLLKRYVRLPMKEQIVEFGCGTGYYSQLLMNLYGEESLIVNDICPQMLDYVSRNVSCRLRQLPGDAETLQFPRFTSMITSCSAIQWFENPERFFKNSLSSLNEGGYLAFSTFGPDNVKEVSSLTGRGLSYLSLEEIKQKLAPVYDVCHAEEEHLTYTFSSTLEVLRHLKNTGVTGLGGQAMTRAELNQFVNNYSNRYSNENGVYLTYHPIYIIARRKK